MNPNQNQTGGNNNSTNVNQAGVVNPPQIQNSAQTMAQVQGQNTTLGNSQVNASVNTNTLASANITQTNNNGNNQSINTPMSVKETMKEVNINYKPPSKFKTFLLVIFFVFLIGFVIFLPEINSFVEQYKANKNAALNEKIVNGDLVCTLSKNTSQLDISYEAVFGFTDNKLINLDYLVTTRGDITLDEDTLVTENMKCENLKNVTSTLNGVSVACEYVNDTITQKEKFTYSDIDLEKVTSAYSEAGGTYPEFEYNEDMDYIEKNMKASGYTCERRS